MQKLNFDSEASQDQVLKRLLFNTLNYVAISILQTPVQGET